MEQTLERKVHFIPARKPQEQERRAANGRKRVAAYCRVSTDNEEQITSYEAQKAYYTQKIKENPDWELAGIFADEGLSGTSMKHRTKFNKMIAACKRGRVDMILTKSISRFARNTVDCLETVRMLKAYGIVVVFEKENISTLTEQTEFMITLHSAFAQAESESMSRNIIWGREQSKKNGKVPFQYSKLLGYRKGADGNPEIVPEEAETVKRIYRLYLDGWSEGRIQKFLTAEGAPTSSGIKGWSHQVIHSILTNERYIGDGLVGKTFVTDCISKKVKKNNGERSMAYVENNHPAIIPRDIFYRVREEMTRRTSKRKVMQKSGKTEQGKYSSKYALTELLVCGECGTPYKRCTWSRNGNKRIVWRCVSRLEFGTKYCHDSPTLDEDRLQAAILAAMNETALSPRGMGGDILDFASAVYGNGSGGSGLPALRERMAEITAQQSSLLEAILKDMDSEELNTKAVELTERKLALQAQIAAIQADERRQGNRASRMAELEEFLRTADGRFTEYDDVLVRKMIDKITVTSAETIRIHFRDMDVEVERRL